MFELAKKGFYMGLGLAGMTKDKAEAFARGFAQKANLTEDEGKKFADYIHEESQKAQDNLKSTVENMVRKTTSKMPCMKRIDELEARLARIEAHFNTCCGDDGNDACSCSAPGDQTEQ